MQQELDSRTSTSVMSADASKVLRNTYAMLALTLMVSAIAAGASVAMAVPFGAALVMDLAAIGILWLVLPRVANTSAGVWVVFAFTALMGAGLGPTLSYYLAFPGGDAIITQALGGTALVFFALSGYVLATGKDFSFLGGFLFVGLMVLVFGMLGVMVAGLFGVQVSGLHLAFSAVGVFLFSGFILYDTSRIINGGETNYLYATVSLYLDILNLFTSLLHILGAFSGDD